MRLPLFALFLAAFVLGGCATSIPLGPLTTAEKHRAAKAGHQARQKPAHAPSVAPLGRHPSASLANPAPVSGEPQAKPRKVRQHWWQVWRKKAPKN